MGTTEHHIPQHSLMFHQINILATKSKLPKNKSINNFHGRAFIHGGIHNEQEKDKSAIVHENIHLCDLIIPISLRRKMVRQSSARLRSPQVAWLVVTRNNRTLVLHISP